MKIAVLGAGMVGSTIAIDLAQQYTVTSFDISEKNLQGLQAKCPAIACERFNLQQWNQYAALLQGFDFVVCAVPGHLGYRAIEQVIKAGKSLVDISFFPEDALQLDALAKQHNVTAIVDCGVAPGMSNLIAGYHNEEMDIANFSCYVGGLPKARKMPWQYKAPFSPIDVLEEYTRPARLKENGSIVTKPALSELETIDFEATGPLEAFNTDGLRSLLFTLPHIPNMKEKTMRYPGHVALIEALRDSRFLSTEPVQLQGQSVVPIQLTAHLLMDEWKLAPEDEELTIMKIELQGKALGQEKTVEYFLLDEYDQRTQTSSMSRTTGYTCNAALQLLIKGLFTQKGVFPPELVGKYENCFLSILHYLAERNVRYLKTER
jgi:lysine 6-dehydrogenase